MSAQKVGHKADTQLHLDSWKCDDLLMTCQRAFFMRWAMALTSLPTRYSTPARARLRQRPSSAGRWDPS